MWAFWQISGWYGQWSKLHYFKDYPNSDLALCGRYANPEYGSRVTPFEQDEKCKICLRIFNKISVVSTDDYPPKE